MSDRRLRRTWALALLLPACASVHEQPAGPSADSLVLLGISPTPKGSLDRWTDAAFDEAYRTARAGGVDLATWRHEWGELEPALQSYRWGEVDYEISLSERHQLGYSFVLELIHTNVLGKLPSDLPFASFDDPQLVESCQRMLTELVRRHSGKIDYIWIGNEFNDYLGRHPEEVEPFHRLYVRLRDAVHATDGRVTVGALGAYHLARNHDQLDLLRRYAAGEDALGLTVYMQDDHEKPRAERTEEYFRTLFSSFPQGRIAIVETAWSTAGVDGSEERQVAFVEGLVQVLHEHRNRLAFFSWFNLYDWPEEVCDQIMASYGLEPGDPAVGDLRLFLLSTAFFSNGGAEKPAWAVWKDRIGSRF